VSNFKELQDSVLFDRFAESRREDAGEAINYRYGRLWAAEPWVFKLQSTSIAVPQNAQSVALGVGKIMGLWDSTTVPGYATTEAIRPEDFYNLASRVYGTYPTGWTVIGDTLYFDRIASSDRTLTVISEKPFSELVEDEDIPAIPVEFHPMLVSGASSYLLKQENDDSWQGFEAEWDAAMADLRKGYLTSASTYEDSYPGWP
jgi:hypothetical protein